jgi:predicted PurR-regulated permease PerM
MLSGGHAGRVWAERNFGFPPFAVRRMYAAFMETGRGLFVGVGATSFVQAVVATLTFLALGVPRAFLFGALTLFCSIIPALGSGIVWAPIAIGLALQGEPGKAALLVGIGVFVIGTVDNLVRPMFARFGALKMSTFSLFVTMLGGIALLGPFGILAGPLLFRCAREALELRTEIAAGKARMTEPCPPAAAPREAPVRFRGGSLAHEASEA